MTIDEQKKIAESCSLYSVQIARMKDSIGSLPTVVWTADVHDIEQLVRCITKDMLVFDASCGSSKDFDTFLYKSKGMPLLVKNTEQAEVNLIEDIWYALKDGKKIVAHANLTHGSMFTPRLCNQIGVAQFCYLFDNDEEIQFIKDNHQDSDEELDKTEENYKKENNAEDYKSIIRELAKKQYHIMKKNNPDRDDEELIKAAYKQAKSQIEYFRGE